MGTRHASESQGFVTAPDGVRLGYRLWRADKVRPLIVLVHGLASNLTRWSEFVDKTALKRDWDILRLDLRGHASSMSRGRIGHASWCADLRMILDSEGYDAVVLVGHSLGAQVALHFAARYPESVRALVLIDPVFPQALRGTLRRARRWRPLIAAAIPIIRVFNWLGLKRRKFPVRDLRVLDQRTRAILAENPNAKLAELYMAPGEDLKYLPLANYLQDLNAVVSPLPALRMITQPVLVLLSASTAVSATVQMQAQIAQFPHSETAMIHADHWPLTERPDEVRQAIEDWLIGKIG
ncbi:MAG: hypothetical protein AMS22_04265 [Thiotrichales bacterium SG8_50]|nr:MAG: hypothetical protein AMS22_04265 [Thiotrichales bacterium SG8_50]